MSLWRQLTRGTRGLSNREAASRDIADEIEHYLEEATTAHQARGLPRQEAARVARVDLGGRAAVREQVRELHWETRVDALLADLTYCVRCLRKSPAFSSMCVLTLALGIGASTAIFSVVNPVLFQSLPYPQAGRIVMIWDGQNGSRGEVTFGTYREVVQRTHSFESLAVMRPAQMTLTGPAEPERIDGQYVSADYFRVLGVRPALGRDFADADDQPGAPTAVVISDGLWRRRFHADPSIAGRQVLIQDTPVTIVGVMPREFENVLAPSAEIWTTLKYDRSLPLNGREWGHHLRMVGRLRSALDPGQAYQELSTMAAARLADFPRPEWARLPDGFIAGRLQDELTRGVRPALLAVVGAVALLLGIACVNVANFLLARAAKRRAELAVRAALGAPRLRLARLVVLESLLLAVVGGALGVALARAAMDAFTALAPAELPRVASIRIDGGVLAFALGLTALVGFAIGLIPVLASARADVYGTLQQRSARLAPGHPGLRRGLVVVQVAFAFVLLVGAGLLLRSLKRLFDVPPGFDPDRVLTMQVQTAGARFRDAGATYRFFEEALDAVKRVPGVSAAAFTSQLPLTGDEDIWGVHFESAPAEAAEEDHDGYRYAVSPGYFEAMRIPLRRGRFLNAHDSKGAPLAAVINESFARRRLPGLDPIGQRVRVGPNEGPWFTVVGVVGDVKQTSLALTRADGIYVTAAQWARFADSARWLIIRAQGDAASLAPAIRKAVWSIDKDQAIVRVATLEDRLRVTEAERRFVFFLFEAFAVMALVLAATGTYSLLAGGVIERTREIGIRSALGATRIGIMTLVLRQGMKLVGLGLAIGLAGAMLTSRALASLLFGVSQLDPLTYAGVVLTLACVSAIACGLPAWRASRVLPSDALRAE